MHNAFAIAINIQGVLFCKKRSPLKLLNKILEKITQKNFIFCKVTDSINEFIHIFFKVFAKSLSNLVQDFWENSFRKPKQLLAVNRLIWTYQWVYQKFMVPGPLTCHSFLHRITTSWYIFHEEENAASSSCEDIYSR